MENALDTNYTIDLSNVVFKQDTKLSRIIEAIQKKAVSDTSYSEHSDSYSDAYGVFV